jgi:hypothetical protein
MKILHNDKKIILQQKNQKFAMPMLQPLFVILNIQQLYKLVFLKLALKLKDIEKSIFLLH